MVPSLWICLICPSGPTAGWHFVLLFYIDTASKVKKWQMWHLRCCQVTVQSWGKLDFDWLLVTTVKNKIDLLAVTDDDGWPVAEVDICGSWRRLGFLVHNSRFYFVVISSFISCCHFVLPAHLCSSWVCSPPPHLSHINIISTASFAASLHLHFIIVHLFFKPVLFRLLSSSRPVSVSPLLCLFPGHVCSLHSEFALHVYLVRLRFCSSGCWTSAHYLTFCFQPAGLSVCLFCLPSFCVKWDSLD